MILDDVPRDSADAIVEALATIYPKANARILVEDVALRDLGFKDYAPCRLELDIDDDESYWELYDILDEYEQFSYHADDGSTDEEYCKEHEKELTALYYIFQREE